MEGYNEVAAILAFNNGYHQGYIVPSLIECLNLFTKASKYVVLEEDFLVSASKLVTIANPHSLEVQMGKEGNTQRRQVIGQNPIKKEDIKEIIVIRKDSGKTSLVQLQKLSAPCSSCLIVEWYRNCKE